MYSLEVRESVSRIFRKMERKDQARLEQINKKILEIRENPHHFKPLRAPMQNQREAHIGSFVLTYTIDESKKLVTIEDYDHHDNIFSK